MMLPSAREVSSALFGAWRLAHLDKSGLTWFGSSVEDFWKSFFAAVIVAPGHILVLLLRLTQLEIAADLLSIVLIQTLAYAIIWLAFPLAMHHVSEAMGREHRYQLFIVAFNWIKVIQMLVLLPVAALVETGWLPLGLGGLLNATVAVAILFYTWFTTRLALETTGPAAAGIVFLDILLVFLITSVADKAIT